MKPEVFNRRTPGVTETEAKIIKGILDGAAIGELARYEDMTKALGRNVRGQCETALYRALRDCLKEGKVFDVIPTEGYKRLADTAVVDNSARFFRHIRRTSAKVSARLASVDPEKLDDRRRGEYFSQSSAVGALALFSSGSSLRRIGENTTSAPLPVGKIFELFR